MAIKFSDWKPKLISFIIPTLDKVDLLEQCLSSVHGTCMAGKPSDIEYDIIVVQDGKPSEITEHLKSLCAQYNCIFLQAGKSFGYTAAINLGMKKAAGDLLVLLNDDIFFKQKEWLYYIMKSLQLNPQVGIVGCRLIYPDRRIQHGGMHYTGNFQLLSHKYWGLPENEPAAQKVTRTVALTGAILAVKRPVVDKIGFLNRDFVMLCSDTDYCLTAHQNGFWIIYNGRAYAIHHESQTRKQFSNPGQLSRIEFRDLTHFYKKWSAELEQMHIKGMI